jgi:hypothetical protein
MSVGVKVEPGLRGRLSDVLEQGHKAGNWADYTAWNGGAGGFVYCGWMDLHNDKENGLVAGDEVWGFRAYYWNMRAVFIHTLDRREGGEMVVVRRTAEPVFFRADLLHGLVPAKAVDEVLRSKSTRGLAIDWRALVAPVLVWRWVDRATGNEYVLHKGVWSREALVKG